MRDKTFFRPESPVMEALPRGQINSLELQSLKMNIPTLYQESDEEIRNNPKLSLYAISKQKVNAYYIGDKLKTNHQFIKDFLKLCNSSSTLKDIFKTEKEKEEKEEDENTMEL